MERNVVVSLTAFIIGFAWVTPTFSAGNLVRQRPIGIRVDLGAECGDLKFVSGNLTFETGKLYKLVLTNPSKGKHYFTASGLAAKVYTRKAQVVDRV